MSVPPAPSVWSLRNVFMMAISGPVSVAVPVLRQCRVVENCISDNHDRQAGRRQQPALPPLATDAGGSCCPTNEAHLPGRSTRSRRSSNGRSDRQPALPPLATDAGGSCKLPLNVWL